MEKSLYLLAELDNDTQLKIRKFEKIISGNGFIGRQTLNIPYHITLGAYSTEYESFLGNLLDKIWVDFTEINISYSGFGLFSLDVLYLNPCMNKKLIELYDFVSEKSYYKGNDLAAHTTIFMDEKENVYKIIPKITENFEKISGKIKYVSLYEFFPARFIRRIELK